MAGNYRLLAGICSPWCDDNNFKNFNDDKNYDDDNVQYSKQDRGMLSTTFHVVVLLIILIVC